MPDKIFDKVILPVCGNEDNSFMGITTLNGEQNWVSQLHRLKRKDEKVIFKFIRHGPCDACMEEGRGPTCPHYERMPWKSKSKDDDVKEIYRQRGQAELGEQEMSGSSISPLTFIVKPIYIKGLHDRPLHVFNHPPQVIYVAIDPHGGGKTSRTAIMFIANEWGRIVVRSEMCVERAHGHNKVNRADILLVIHRVCLASVDCSALIERVECIPQSGDECTHCLFVASLCDVL